MKISRHSLMTAIKTVAPAVKKSTLPPLECVRIQISGQTIRADATHLDMGLTWRAELGTAFAPTELTILIPLHPIVDLLPTLSGDDVDISVNEKTWRLTLKAGMAKTVLPLLDPQEFPPITEFPTPEGKAFDLARLKDGLFCSSTDGARPMLQCAHVVAKDGQITAQTTDGFMVARMKTQYEGAAFEANILATALAACNGWGDVWFKVKDNGQILIFDQWRMMTCAKVDGNYPPIDQIIPKSKKGYFEDAHLGLVSALRQMGPILKGSLGQKIDIETTPEGVKLSASNETNEFETVIKAKVEGEIKFSMNGAMLLEGVSAARSPLVVEWVDAKSPIVVRNVNTPGWLFVQMPMGK
jgi:DNA polymerase III sliding clamp (beta) subunit (PCNA family)